jgi:hypothetical protein
MKKMRTLLLSISLLIPALNLAQTSPPANAAANSQAQQLRRYNPQMRSVEKKLGEDTLSVSVEKGISPATEQALIEYFMRQYKLVAMGVEIYKAPGAGNRYFVLGTVLKDQHSENSVGVNIFLVLREEGGKVSEVTRTENESDAALRAPVFFLGQNTLLAIVSLSAMDGSLAGHYAYEYAYEHADNTLRPLGEIAVIDKVGMSGSVWITNNSLERATAQYKNNTYYLTLRGKGSLHVPAGMDKYKKIASPGSPVTYFYDGGTWRRAARR